MGISFAGFPDATSFADIEAALGAEITTDFGPAPTAPAADVPNIELEAPPPEPIEPPPEPPTTFFRIPIPSFIQPLIPDLLDVEELIAGFSDGIFQALRGVIFDVDGIIDDAVTKILNPIETLKAAVEVVERTFNVEITNTISTVITEADRILVGVEDKLKDAFDGTLGIIERIIAQITRNSESAFEFLVANTDETIRVIETIAGVALESVIATSKDIITLVNDKIIVAIESSAVAIEAAIGVPFAKLADVLPFQIAELGLTITEGFGSFLDIPELLGDKIKDVFTDLGDIFGLNSLVSLSRMIGQFTAASGLNPSIDEVMSDLNSGKWADEPPSRTSSSIIGAVPFLGTYAQLKYPGVYEKLRQVGMEEERPNIFSVPDGLELLRRFPDDAETVINDLARQGWSNDRIEQLTRLRFQLTPVADTLDAWRRNFIDDGELAGKLGELGWSESDQALLRRLTFRIPPIQDMILFAIRGVFDVEESRAFGEFEGLPSELEAEFISKFDIEGGDFSRQVEVFATEAQKLGLSPEWVAAYWTSHWRLPSLQTAYEMFHRLQPDILEAESDRVAADGFSVSELEFTRPELDRLVRAQDFSSFWRPKLAAIAFNPLTRVDIRRMHKIGLLERDAVVRAYRKVGFSPSDAELMTLFTEAFNAEPDQDQAVEIRQLTKTVILDFVETSILTPEEGVERLKLIGYDKFAAEALVDLELAKVERGLQRDQIDLIEEQVKLQILDLNAASIELDAIGVPAAQKQVIIRKLGVQLAPRPASPSKADLDNFLNQGVLNPAEYRDGLVERGFTNFWIDHYIAAERRLRTKKDLDSLFIGEIIAITEYDAGLVDLGYSETTIVQFVTLIEQAQAEAKEDNS